MWLQDLIFYVPWTAGVVLLLAAALSLIHQLYFGKTRVDRLHTRVVLITGCDTGFGNLLAKRLDTLGIKVIATCLTTTGCAELQKSCSSNMQTLVLDVTEESSIVNAYNRVAKRLENDPSLEFWGLVNNAGVVAYGSFFDWTSIKDMKRVSEVNLWGTVAVTKAFTQLLKKSQGRLVFVASVLGRISPPSLTSYSISKYGIEAFADGLRVELESFNVRVSIIEPGAFKTPINDEKSVSDQLWRAWRSLPKHLQDEHYGLEAFQNMHDRFLSFLKMASPRLDFVVKAMEHALVAKRPKSRYLCGWDVVLFFSWLCLLPSILQDCYMRTFTIKGKGRSAKNR